MIKNIFLPERIGDIFLFSQKYLGLEITKTALIGARVLITGKKVTIYEFDYDPIIKNEEETDQILIANLNKFFQKNDSFLPINLSLPNNLIIFKELTIPFLEEEKIREILPFELEPQIPFSLHNIAFDFIITKQNFVEKKSVIFVAIIQKKELNHVLELIKAAGGTTSKITVDLFALYGLYLIHPIYKNIHEAVALIDVGFQYTAVSYINQQQLQATRSINIGLNIIAKNIAKKTKQTPGEVLEQIIRFGISKTANQIFNKSLEEELTHFYAQLQFTLNTFASQTDQTVQRIILLSRGTKIKELDTQFEKFFELPTEFFNTHKLLELPTLTTKKNINSIPLQNLISFASVYPFSPTSSFDLLIMHEAKEHEQILEKQIIVAFIMLLVFFGTLIGYRYMQVTKIENQINKARKSALLQIKNKFEIVENNLATAVESAQIKLNEEQAIWEDISGASRFSFLKYLQELSSKIDRKGIGLDLKKLILNKKSIILVGQVPDFPDLKTLKEELNESKLFKLASVPQEPNFKEIKLTITPEDGDLS